MKEGILEGLLFVTGEDGLSIEEIEKLLELEKEEALSLIDKLKKDNYNALLTVKLVVEEHFLRLRLYLYYIKAEEIGTMG